MQTWDVVRRLLAETDARSYLELRTPSTAPRHTGHVVDLEFSRAEYLIYRTPAYEPDGPMLQLPTLDEVDELFIGELFDIVFVDPWHSIEHSRRALRWGFDRIAPGGWMVIHDCWPDSFDLLGDYPGNGASWCGDTWRAFQELGRAQLNPWCVINDDAGIGFIGPVDTPGICTVVVNTMSNPSAQWQWMTEHPHEPWLVEAEDWRPDIGHVASRPRNQVGSPRADR